MCSFCRWHCLKNSSSGHYNFFQSQCMMTYMILQHILLWTLHSSLLYSHADYCQTSSFYKQCCESISVQTTTLMFQITILGSISGSDFYNKSKHIHVIFLIWNTSDVHLLLEKQTNKQKIPTQHKKSDSLRTKVKYLECKWWLPVFTWTGLLRDPRSG